MYLKTKKKQNTQNPKNHKSYYMSYPISSNKSFFDSSYITSFEKREQDQTTIKAEQESEKIFRKRARDEEYSPQKRPKQNEKFKPWATHSEENSAEILGEVDWHLFTHGEKFLRALGNGEEYPSYEFKDYWEDIPIYQEGEITINYSDGSKYQGYAVNKKPHGKGKFTTRLGSTYEGVFIEGKLQGEGILTIPPELRYIGNFIDGMPSGKGILFQPKTHIISDTWTHDLQTESGEIYHCNSKMRYKGQIANLMPHGKGTIIFGNDFIYEGEVSFGRPCGKGKLRDAIGNIFISKKWQGNLENAHGKILYTHRSSDSDRLYYVGNFEARQPSGTGTMYYKDGKYYIGKFLGGKRHGSGILFSQKKTAIYARNWTDDKEDG